MDFRASFRAPGEKMFTAGKQQPQAMFKALRRLHGQNLENQGLNDLTEAFQNFVTRARYFSVGKLRRTWSHSAVEFMKYRRLLPMLLADGQNFEGNETDDFDAAIAFQATNKDDRKIIVTNIPPKVTQSQLQSFFSEFGKIIHVSLPRDEKKSSLFGTISRHTKNCGTATITYKRPEDAEKARKARPEQLKFYDQIMAVSAYVPRSKGGRSMMMSDSSRDEEGISRASSTQSLAMSTSGYEGSINLEALPGLVLARVISFLPITDTIRCERVSKRWMEASMQSWSMVTRLTLSRDSDSATGFGKHRALTNVNLKAILVRSGGHLHALDLCGVTHLIDDKATDIIAKNCTHLKELDLSGLRFSWEALSELSDALPRLSKIAYRDMLTCGEKAFWYLIKGYSRALTFVDLRGCRRLHGRCFRLFGPLLETLYLDGCNKIDDMAFEDVATNCHYLKELRMSECYQISDRSLSMLCRHLSELQVLTLCGERFEHLTADGLAHIAHISSLVELAFDYNPLVNDKLLTAIGGGLSQLRSLSLSNAGTDASITSVGINALAKLSKLEQLDLSSIAAVRAGPLLEVAFSCKALEVLHLRNCVYLSDDGVAPLGRCKNLRQLDLSGSILVTSEAVQTFIKAHPQNEAGSDMRTIVVGGTAVEASRLSVRGSAVVVDFSDYSALASLTNSQSNFRIGASMGGGEDSDDDEFESLAAQRSFYIDAVCGNDESPIEDEKELLEWAEREARNLGLIKK